ncbi:hypothetical protein N44_03910 [Microcystis aeruginosa NIES-44]|uniref:Uncharacterized protein n=1 Tax=Microcystis aeruginosa NIES-44 TaxID=449439 RepID=A0A0A1VZ87_MICAE|nr:hypothetical protein N44_03910 [Microcystis aeruginosa NIES-44]
MWGVGCREGNLFLLTISRTSPNPFTVAFCLLPFASSQQAI